MQQKFLSCKEKMDMKLIIAGKRDFYDYEKLKAEVDKLRKSIEIDEIVSGRCSGADKLGERYAREHNIPVKVFPANWDAYGKSAGPIRNRKMALYADVLIAFWDGESRGTKNMILQMKEQKKPYYLVKI